MATKSLKFAFLIILSALMVAQLIEAGRQPTAAIPANPKDPKIVEMGKYAVKEHGGGDKTLSFITVVKAETEAGSGMTTYRMVVSAKDATTGKINNYNAVVSYSSGDLPQLVAFDRAADQLGGYVVIPPPYPKVVIDATAYAIAEHNREHKTSLVLVKITKAESQVVKGINYRITIRAKDSLTEITRTYLTVVNQFQQVFLLLSFGTLVS